MLKNEHGWYLQNHEIYPLLQAMVSGWKVTSKLPTEGFGPVEVRGVTFICHPQAPATKRTWDGREAHRSKHRVMFMCPVCTEWIPFGRAGQHRKGKHHRELWAQMVGYEGY